MDIVPSLPNQMAAQEQWDYVKSEIRRFTQRYAIDYTNWRKKSVKVLQRKRNDFLRSRPSIAIRLHYLPVMDQQIESLQQELKSAGYLKRLHQIRTVERSINFLQDPASGLTVSSRTQLMEISQAFYHEIYSVDPVDEHDIDCCLQDIANLPQLNDDNRRYLISPITIEEIIEQSKKVIRRQISPGSDGLGYVFMHLIYQFSPLKDFITKIYNTALTAGSFPSSWQDLRIYTRIINQRMRSVMNTIINRYQTGSLGDRFIAENGMILNILMEQAHVQRRPEIGLLLDQEKAYDRVHPMYLRQS
ncbi:hypothetical protein G6F45_011268 [Rhizopus arrhizus]|nr:hypothetical protein G6F45_011268 [Rhizopus arrhizus]